MVGQKIFYNHKTNIMTFEEYQKLSKQTAFYPEGIKPFVYIALGLAGESGEVVEKIKHIVRDKNGLISQEDKEGVIKELGDLLWYLTQLSGEFGSSLEEVASLNIEKLFSRKERGALRGRGDNR
jgi:NTP pyrophosphatase (non-canonical NTP hydrolase)